MRLGGLAPSHRVVDGGLGVPGASEASAGGKEPQRTVPEVRALLVHLLDEREWDVEEICVGPSGVRNAIVEPPSVTANAASPSYDYHEVGPLRLRCSTKRGRGMFDVGGC